MCNYTAVCIKLSHKGYLSFLTKQIVSLPQKIMPDFLEYVNGYVFVYKINKLYSIYSIICLNKRECRKRKKREK